MLRTHLLKISYALSDRAMDEASYDSQAMRRFVTIDVLQGRLAGRNEDLQVPAPAGKAPLGASPRI